MIRAILLIACFIGLIIIALRMFKKQATPIKAKKSSIKKPDTFRFKGQIVQDSIGRKGEILYILEEGTKYFAKYCPIGTPKAQRYTLVVRWENTNGDPDCLPANTTLISSVVDTHNPLYPALNYLKWAEFRSSQK